VPTKLLGVIVLSFGVSACGGPSCIRNTDCPQGQRCIASNCQGAGGSGGSAAVSGSAAGASGSAGAAGTGGEAGAAGATDVTDAGTP